MDLNNALDALRGRRRWIVGGVIAGITAATLLTAMAERTYASSTQLFVSVAGPAEETDPLDADSFVQQRLTSYVQVLTGQELAQRVVDDLDLRLTADDVEEKVSAAPLPGTVILQVEVTDTSPRRAQAIAESLSEQFIDRARDLETAAGTRDPAVEIEVLERPELDTSPVSPILRRNQIVGGALGLVLGVGLVLLLIRLDSSVKRASAVRETTGAEVLGRLAENRQMARRRILPEDDRQSPAAESYRALRMGLLHVDGGDPPRVLVVSSSVAGEGATTVAVNLAVSLARAGQRVLLVDGNLRRPCVLRHLGLRSALGLTDVLARTASLREATQEWNDSGLTVLGTGPLPPDIDTVLNSPRLHALLQVMRDSYDWVVIDAPPLLPVVDAAALGALADGCLVVTRYGRTTESQLVEAAAALQRVHARLLGVVLNRVPRSTGRRANRRYPSRSRSAQRPAPAEPAAEERSTTTDQIPAALPHAGDT